jgi:hypothetical protein
LARTRKKSDLFTTLAEIRQSNVDIGERIPDDQIWAAIKVMEKQTAWRRLCRGEERILGDELAREIEWALEGMSFALDRVDALHFAGFPSAIGRIDPEGFFDAQLNYGALTRSEGAGYRAALMLFGLAEFYFWMAAVWDRMGQLLNLFAFNVRNVAKSGDGWRQIFGRFRDNFANVDQVRNSEDYKTILRLHNAVYEKLYHRRNVLSHKGSLIARIRAEFEDPRSRRLLREYVLDHDTWDFQSVVEESEKLAECCGKASQALQRFLTDFLRWRRDIWRAKGGLRRRIKASTPEGYFGEMRPVSTRADSYLKKIGGMKRR